MNDRTPEIGEQDGISYAYFAPGGEPEAGVPNSRASSTTSQPPTSSRPASFSREPIG